MDAVGVTAGVLPGHVVIGVGIVGRLVHPRAPAAQQVPQVAAQQIPVEVVWLVAVLALDDQPTDARRTQQRLVDLQVGEVLEDVLPLGLGQRLGLGVLSEVVETGGRVGGIAVEGVDRLILHPLTVLTSDGCVLARTSCPSPESAPSGWVHELFRLPAVRDAPWNLTRPALVPLGLTFDDVLLQPGESDIVPSRVNTNTRLTRNID